MNEDSPENARIFALEKDVKRHEVWLSDQDRRITQNEKCIESATRLENMIKDEVMPVLKNLNECKIANEAVAKTKVPFMDTKWGERLWNIAQIIVAVLITWGVAVNQFMAGK